MTDAEGLERPAVLVRHRRVGDALTARLLPLPAPVPHLAGGGPARGHLAVHGEELFLVLFVDIFQQRIRHFLRHFLQAELGIIARRKFVVGHHNAAVGDVVLPDHQFRRLGGCFIEHAPLQDGPLSLLARRDVAVTDIAGQSSVRLLHGPSLGVEPDVFAGSSVLQPILHIGIAVFAKELPVGLPGRRKVVWMDAAPEVAADIAQQRPPADIEHIAEIAVGGDAFRDAALAPEHAKTYGYVVYELLHPRVLLFQQRGGGGLFLRPVQLFLHFYETGDVAVDYVHYPRHSMPLARQSAARADPGEAAFSRHPQGQLCVVDSACDDFSQFVSDPGKLTSHAGSLIIASEAVAAQLGQLFLCVAAGGVDGVVAVADGEIPIQQQSEGADANRVGEQFVLCYAALQLGVEPADLLALAVFPGDVLKAADQAGDAAVHIHRRLAGHNVALFAASYALALYTVGAFAGQHTQLVVPELPGSSVPTHIFVVFAEYLLFGAETVIVKKGPVGAQKATVCVLPEQRRLGGTEDVLQQRIGAVQILFAGLAVLIFGGDVCVVDIHPDDAVPAHGPGHAAHPDTAAARRLETVNGRVSVIGRRQHGIIGIEHALNILGMDVRSPVLVPAREDPLARIAQQPAEAVGDKNQREPAALRAKHGQAHRQLFERPALHGIKFVGECGHHSFPPRRPLWAKNRYITTDIFSSILAPRHKEVFKARADIFKYIRNIHKSGQYIKEE